MIALLFKFLKILIFYFQVLDRIQELNEDPDCHGIIVQLPLDCMDNIDSALCTNKVIPEKDVDG